MPRQYTGRSFRPRSTGVDQPQAGNKVKVKGEFVKFDTTGKMVAIQQDGVEKASWFFLQANVIPYFEKVEKGEVITVSVSEKDGEKFVTFLEREQASAPQRSFSSPTATSSFKGKYQERSPDIQNLIVRQSVMSSTATIISGLEGITLDNVADIATELFDTLLEKVYEKNNQVTDTGKVNKNPSPVVSEAEESDLL